ncbi:MAG: hypothetical protein WCI57_00505 [Candidatus Berkelbacteria bacterium]
MKLLKFISNSALAALIGLILLAPTSYLEAASSSKVAPDELLPISVQLSNFGGTARVDVSVKYSLLNSTGVEIYAAVETVAVETSASYVKTIQIPANASSGSYTEVTAVTYPGQVAPATTRVPFTVEKKIFGVFLSDFYLYSGIAVVMSLLLILIGRMLIKRRRVSRFSDLDYDNIPSDQRPFYEILSDTIMQMRARVGDDAIFIAQNISGLKIDAKTGRVLSVTESPAKIIANLVSAYEVTLGKKVSFSLRRDVSTK